MIECKTMTLRLKGDEYSRIIDAWEVWCKDTGITISKHKYLKLILEQGLGKLGES